MSLPRFATSFLSAIARLKYRFGFGPPHLKLGRLGEDLAVNTLHGKGYRIIGRNLKVSGREVDIVAIEGDMLVFIEVKTRRDGSSVHPMLAVDNKRRERLRKAAHIYASSKGLRNISIRFDVVTVDFGQSESGKVELIRNAF